MLLSWVNSKVNNSLHNIVKEEPPAPPPPPPSPKKETYFFLNAQKLVIKIFRDSRKCKKTKKKEKKRRSLPTQEALKQGMSTQLLCAYFYITKLLPPESISYDVMKKKILKPYGHG